jgi:protein DGCR14
MSDQTSSSNALVRKRAAAEMALMPPPPQVKKIKRPKKVLDEDTYTEALSQIIARDFFPGLLEAETQQEYLDALESKDAAWISSASRRLQHVMTPGRGRTKTPGRLPTNLGQPVDGRTPTTYVGDTPVSEARTAVSERPAGIDTNMSLTQFQLTYTSEDNESFYKLVDKQNQKKAEKYSWLWHSNKLPSKQMIAQKEVKDRIAQTRSLKDDGVTKKNLLAIADSVNRPAMADTWKLAPKNSFMFDVEGVNDEAPTVSEMAEKASLMGPKSINYHNTRAPVPHAPKRSPSPTASSIQHAVKGDPRQRYADSNVTGDETPRVNGYAFVDDEDDDTESTANVEPPPVIHLGPGDSNNPFKIQDQRKRETLHERMVERIARSNKESVKHGFTGKAGRLSTPKFPSSPRVSGGLTPAAQRLWSSMGSPGRARESSFGQSTPKKPKSSLLRSVARPPSRKE